MKPLEDIRIVSLEQWVSAPFGTVHMADLGAEVIKIEDPRRGGDSARYATPYQEGEDSLFFETFNRNKKSVSLDLRNPAGRKVFEDLVKVSDAVYSNFRGDVPKRLRITYDELKHINPRIVCCALSGFGMTGPRAADPSYDYMIQGAAGWMSMTGEPDGPPVKSGLPVVDLATGFAAALSLMVGVHAARRDGVGTDWDTSLFDVALSMLSYPGTWHLTSGFEPMRTRQSAHLTLVPFQTFRTANGWIVAGGATQAFWKGIVSALGRPELADAPRFETFENRRQNAVELLAIIEPIFESRPTAHWLAALRAADVPCDAVNTVAEAVEHPQAAARAMVVEVDHPRFGTVRQLASPLKAGQFRPSYRRAPQRDEDRLQVLESVLGYSADRIAESEAAGAFGTPQYKA